MGALPWGTHFCQFYGDRADLEDTLVPYFKAGLDSNEQCLWVTSSPFRAEDARVALRTAVPDLELRIARNQIEILDHETWYLRTGRSDADSTLNGWVEREQTALAQGFAGLRLTGNTYWVERSDWKSFVDYESRVSATFAGRKIIGMCSYCLGRCQPHDILDVVANHQFALTRRGGEWQVLESASLAMAKNDLSLANDDLERRVRERTEALERAVQARDEFLSVASHELKTPITSLQLYVQGILRGQEAGTLTPAQVSPRLKRVFDQCRRLEKLVNNLLDVSRAEDKHTVLNRERFDLSLLVTETSERFSDEFARARCRLALDAPEPVEGNWDRMRLEQLVSNLLQNVVRYAPSSNVGVSVETLGSGARLVVKDDGPGIDPADHPRLFKRFSRVQNDQFVGGFGLGLWIVKEVAEAHGGTVSVHSNPDQGAEFRILLPRD